MYAYKSFAKDMFVEIVPLGSDPLVGAEALSSDSGSILEGADCSWPADCVCIFPSS